MEDNSSKFKLGMSIPNRPKTGIEYTNMRRFTNVLRDVVDDEKLWERAWKYCKKLKTYSSCPLEKKSYYRLEKFKDDEELIDAIFEALKRYEFPERTTLRFDIIGYVYSLGLLAISEYKREEHIEFFWYLYSIAGTNRFSIGFHMYNITNRLKDDFPDLAPLAKAFTEYSDYELAVKLKKF